MSKKINSLLLAGLITISTSIDIMAIEQYDLISKDYGLKVGEDIVDIPDINLKKRINEHLKKNPNSDITKSELESITCLRIVGADIERLDGIQYCNNLEFLQLENNKISDITPLAKLTKLKEVDLTNNKISDITPLASLINLEDLNLAQNNIEDEDIVVISNLINLKSLCLTSNKISNIKPLSRMTKLQYFSIVDNNIDDISVVSNYKDLETLHISENRITDLRPVSDLKNITYGSFDNQIINLEPIYTKNGKVCIEIPKVYDKYGNILELNDCQGSSSYEIVENSLKFDNIQEDITVGMNFKTDFITDSGYRLYYNVLFYQPIIVSKQEIFPDISGHWAETTIKSFVEQGYINGYGDSTFKPNNLITRAEFVKIVNKYCGLTKTSGKVFNDTQTHWAKDEIDIAVTNGVCNGVSSTEFKPNDPITREQASVMLSNYKKLSDENLDKIDKYNDSMNVSSWAKTSVEGVLEQRYMNGYPDNTFRPKNNMTRSEAVVTLSRVNK